MEADGRIQHPTELRAFLDPLRICTSIFWLCLSQRVVLKQCLLGGFMLVVDVYSRKLLWKRWSFANRPEISWNSTIVNHQPYPTNWPLTFVPLSTLYGGSSLQHYRRWHPKRISACLRYVSNCTAYATTWTVHKFPLTPKWKWMVYHGVPNVLYRTCHDEFVIQWSMLQRHFWEPQKNILKRNTSAHLVQCLKNKTVPFWPDHKVSYKDSNSTYRSYKL